MEWGRTGDGSSAYAVRGLVRRHGTVVANDRIDLDIAAGEIFGLLGPNGAGKSTLVRQLVGLLRPDEGSILLHGVDITTRPSHPAHVVAYLPQDEFALADLPVRLAVETTARLRGMGRRPAAAATDALLDELGLGDLAGRTVGAMSGGQRRLAGVAAALAGDRDVLVLDEPTTGLDPTARRAVWSAVERRRVAGVTVVLVTHNVLEAEAVLDRVAVLDRGHVIACDTPGRLKASVSAQVRLELVWRSEPPLDDLAVTRLRPYAEITGRRWSLRLPIEQARSALAELTTGAAFAALDDFTLATPTLEDVYLTLGGAARDLERA